MGLGPWVELAAGLAARADEVATWGCNREEGLCGAHPWASARFGGGNPRGARGRLEKAGPWRWSGRLGSDTVNASEALDLEQGKQRRATRTRAGDGGAWCDGSDRIEAAGVRSRAK